MKKVLLNNSSILIAGIGGASLGTEIFKSLMLTKRYMIYGCDISPYAFGHYQNGFHNTFLVDPNHYVESVRTICLEHNIRAVIPGGEQPMTLLGPYQDEFNALGIKITSNTSEVITVCANKDRLFDHFYTLNIPCPQTIHVCHESELIDFPCPCIIKPASGTGGSQMVFLASTKEEAKQYLSYVLQNTEIALLQEYISVDEGEFTIGVLSLPNKKFVGAIALRRLFNAKLSVMSKTNTGLISSGYSQGLIDLFPNLCEQAKKIAIALHSAGPINIQGRVRNGVLLPFEINPRFSASTYLRAIAGFNEIDIYLQYVLYGIESLSPQIRPGYYLRSLDEVYVPMDGLKQ